MNKEKILNELDTYNYDYTVMGDLIKINLGFSHIVTVNLSEPNKIIIKEKLTHWNFLTGGINMELKNAMLYNFIGILLFGFFCLYQNLSNKFNPISLFILQATWVILFTVYYVVKYENFKQQIINCTRK